ncbi:hypothetical protein [Noviherbaspirillum pedocola]|uniref:Uncharacterized protein n=1 Tax=Noviherbaspirillum pedocola TaxID=2801341 RepID=A0A934SUI4_9BURK|nr:hypothetical protein [Noviherbaspirillum pedocola]MBK4735513.1 hypothetical protein [Noviherbaspirillum pedocola]
MSRKKAVDLDNDVLLEIVVNIHRIVEAHEGQQNTRLREIDYAIHAALTLIEAATRYFPNDEDRVASVRSAVALFAEIAEADYIRPIYAAAVTKPTKH